MGFSTKFNQLINWFTNWPRWVWHVLFWVSLFIMIRNQFDRVWLLTPNGNNTGKWLMISCHMLATMSSFYWLGYYVKPKYFDKKKYGKVAMLLIVYWFVLSAQTHILFYILDTYYPPSNPYISKRLINFNKYGVIGYYFVPEVSWFIWAHLFNYVMTPILIKWSRDVHRKSEVILSMTKEKAIMELTFLRSQINPHFLFNTFNSVYASMDRDIPLAKSIFEDLTEMLRYALYETNAEYVSLKKEALFIEDYLSLENIRYQGEPLMELSIDDIRPDIGVPPMILITFIENAIKHGLNPLLGSGFIKLQLMVVDNRVIFELRNSKMKDYKPAKVGGIGLTNIRKRLMLLFDKDYVLNLEDQGSQYFVRLEMPVVMITAADSSIKKADDHSLINA